MICKQTLHKYVVSSVLILSGINPVVADQTGPQLVDQFSAEFPQAVLQLERMLDTQNRLEQQAQSMQQELEQGRRMRAMQRETVLRTELNLAWIYDEFENWDCRVAEQKTVEVELRLAQLREFNEHLNAMCSVVDGNARNQQQACHTQRNTLAISIANLEKLSSQYTSSCLLTLSTSTGSP